MIFVTVGSQVPFDRMIEAVDAIAPLLGGKELVVQALASEYKAKNFTTVDYISPSDFKSYVERAELVISHAGTGTILSVSQLEKPMIVFPRSGKLKETRNDHQVATCRMMEQTTKLQVAYDAEGLRQKIEMYMRGELPVMDKMSPHASPQLLNSIKDFIEGDRKMVVAPIG